MSAPTGNVLGSSIIKLTLDKSEYDKLASAAESDAKGSASRISSIFATVGKTAALGMAAGGAAVAGVAAKGVTDFIGYQQQLNEVFTLLPGMSKEAMGKMSDDVKQFSKDFGVLPEQEIPALYQAISAGVPKDNVFDFLATAQKAAVGGVTDLQTAVDGISSVVNAYGTDTISAAQASDLMFTAVKDGKTDFQQLSQTLFNVIPTASALGVQFGDVTAAIAAMTAQGTPTSVATTQMRQMLVELSKSGSGAADEFEKLSGKSFKEFIAGGGNVQQALQIMEEGAKKSGLGINDLFSSVEAGNAALALTGKGTDAFTKDLADMANSAGATDAAYGTMDQGIGRSLDKLKASFKVALIDIGEKFAPAVAAVADDLIKYMPQIEGVLDAILTGVGDALNAVKPYLTEFVQWFIDVGVPAIQDFADQVKTFINDQVIPTISTIADKVGPAFDALAGAFTDMLPTMKEVGGFIGDNIKPILIGLAGALTAIVVPAFIAWSAAAITAAAGTIAALAPVIAPIAAIGVAVGLLYAAWDSNFLGIQDKTKELWGYIKPILENVETRLSDFWEVILPKLEAAWDTMSQGVQDVVHALSTVLDIVFGGIKDFIQTYHTQISDIISKVWDAIYTVVDTEIHLISDVIQLVLDIISGNWSGAWNDIKSFASDLWNGLEQLGADVFGILRDELSIIWDAISTKVHDVWDGIKGYLSDKVDTIKGDITGAISLVRDTLAGIWHDIETKVGDTWDAIKKRIDDGKDAIKSALMWPFEQVRDQIGEVGRALANNFLRPLNDVITGFNTLANGLKDAVNWISGKLGLGDLISGSLKISTIPLLAQGARNFAGGMAIVGENGPELVKLPNGADIYSNGKSKDILGSKLPAAYGGGIGDIASGIISGIGDVVGDVASTVLDWVGKGASWVVDQALSGLNVDMPGVFSSIPSAFINMLKPYLIDFVQGLLDSLGSIVSAQNDSGGGGGTPSSYGFIKPISGSYTQGFWMPPTHTHESAIDWMAARGSSVWAPKDGTISAWGWNLDGATGPTVVINHPGGWTTRYGHISEFLGSVGQAVKQGQVFAKSGDPAIDGGAGSGAHLHMALLQNGSYVQGTADQYFPLASGGFFNARNPKLALIGEGQHDEIVSPVPIMQGLIERAMNRHLNDSGKAADGKVEVNFNGPATFGTDQGQAEQDARTVGWAIQADLRRRGLR